MRRLLLFFVLGIACLARAQNTASGSIPSTGGGASCVAIDITGQGMVGISVTGTWTGTLQAQIIISGDAPQNVQVTPYSSSTPQATITANGAFNALVAGGTSFQLCGNTVASGTVNVKLNVARVAARGGSAPPAFSAVTAGTNTAALAEGAGGSITPVSTGQVAGSQLWTLPTLNAPALSFALTGGSLLSGRSSSVIYVLNTVAGHTLGSDSSNGSNTTFGCSSGSVCQLTVTSPSVLVSGYSTWSVYAQDCAATPCGGSEVLQAACTNLAIGANCTLNSVGAGAALPTTNTAYVQPSPLLASECAPGIIPTLFVPDVSGNYHTQAGVDPNNLLFSPAGTFEFCRRTWFNDTKTSPGAGFNGYGLSNGFVSIEHLAGTGTTAVNQDRALWVNMRNGTADSANHYGLAALQVEHDFQGTPNMTGGIDTEVAAGSFQVLDATTGGNGGGLANGIEGIRAAVFKNSSFTGWGRYWGVNAITSCCGSGGMSPGTEMAALGAQWTGGNGTLGNVIGVGLDVSPPSTATRYGFNWGIWGHNVNTYVPVAGSDHFIQNDIHDWDVYLDAPVEVDAITNSNFGAALPVNSSLSVTGSVALAQIPSAWSAGTNPTCSGGASTYSYVFVAVDANGGTSNSATLSTTAACTNPLTGGNAATFNSFTTPQYGTGNAYSEAVRIDVYRTAGPMALGKIGSLPATTGYQRHGGISFSDTGLAASGTLPTGNSTGGVGAFTYTTNTNCAVNSVSPAACGSAAAGAVVIPTTTTTYTVNTSAVTAASRIFLFPMSFAGNLPSAPTCVAPAVTSSPTISAISAGVSFTLALPSTTGQTCWQYNIMN